MKKRYLQVLVEVPAEASVAETDQYIRDELRAAGGQFRTDDPLFYGVEVLKIRSVRL